MVKRNPGPHELHATTRVGRKEFLGADVGDKHVLMNVENGVYIGLDGVGKGIWERLEEPQTIASVCEQLKTDYLVSDQGLFEHDVLEFIAALRLHGLLEVIP